MVGIERRGNQSYYYHKQRRGKQVVSIYCGGEFAKRIAGFQAAQRNARARQRLAERAIRADEERVDDSLKALEQMTRALVHGVLLAQGYHTHKGQWRKQR